MPNNLEYSKLNTWDQYALAIESWSGKLSSIKSIISNTNKIIVYAEENLSYLCYINGSLITILPNTPNLDVYKEYIPLVTIAGVIVTTAPYFKEAAMAARVLVFSANIGSKISSSIINNTTTETNEQPIIAPQDTNNHSKPQYLKTLSYIGYACSYGDLLSRGACNTLNYLEPIINYYLVEDTAAISNSLVVTNYAFNKLKYISTISTTISAIKTALDTFNTGKAIVKSAVKYKSMFVTYILQNSVPNYDLNTKKPIILNSIKSETHKQLINAPKKTNKKPNNNT